MTNAENPAISEADVLHIELGSSVVEAMNSQRKGVDLQPGIPVAPKPAGKVYHSRLGGIRPH